MGFGELRSGLEEALGSLLQCLVWWSATLPTAWGLGLGIPPNPSHSVIHVQPSTPVCPLGARDLGMCPLLVTAPSSRWDSLFPAEVDPVTGAFWDVGITWLCPRVSVCPRRWDHSDNVPLGFHAWVDPDQLWVPKPQLHPWMKPCLQREPAVSPVSLRLGNALTHKA